MFSYRTIGKLKKMDMYMNERFRKEETMVSVKKKKKKWTCETMKKKRSKF